MAKFQAVTVYSLHALLKPHIEFSIPLIFRASGSPMLRDFFLYSLQEHLKPSLKYSQDLKLKSFSDTLIEYIDAFLSKEAKISSHVLANIIKTSFAELDLSHTKETRSWRKKIQALANEGLIEMFHDSELHLVPKRDLDKGHGHKNSYVLADPHELDLEEEITFYHYNENGIGEKIKINDPQTFKINLERIINNQHSKKIKLTQEQVEILISSSNGAYLPLKTKVCAEKIIELEEMLFHKIPEEELLSACIEQFIEIGFMVLETKENLMDTPKDIATMFSPCFISPFFPELEPNNPNSTLKLKRMSLLFTSVIEEHYKKKMELSLNPRSSPKISPYSSFLEKIKPTTARKSSSGFSPRLFFPPSSHSHFLAQHSLPSFSLSLHSHAESSTQSYAELTPRSPKTPSSIPSGERRTLQSISDPIVLVSSHHGLQREAIKILSSRLKESPEALETKHPFLNRSLLHLAALKGNDQILFFLLNQKLSPLLEDNNGELPLHLVARNGNLICLKHLLNAMADAKEPLRKKNHAGENPFHLAIKAQHKKIILILLEQAQEFIDEVDADGNTPLHLLAQAPLLGPDYNEILFILAKNGADFSLKNHGPSSFSPLELALSQGREELFQEVMELQTEKDSLEPLSHGH